MSVRHAPAKTQNFPLYLHPKKVKNMEEKIISQITENAKQLLDKELQKWKNDEPFKGKCPIQEGIHEILQIKILNQRVGYALNNFDWDSFDHKFQLLEIEKVTKEEFAPMAEKIAQNLENYFLENKDSFAFQYRFKVDFSFRSYKKSFVFENSDKKIALKNAMETYIQKVFVEKTLRIKENRDIIILCSHLLDFSLMQYSENQMIDFIENAFDFFKTKENKKWATEFEQSIFHQLSDWKEQEFLPIFYDIQKEFMFFKMSPKPELALKKEKSAPKLDASKIDEKYLPKVQLFVRQGLWRVQKKEPYGVGKKDLELAVSDFNSAEAKKYLKEGSGILPKELIYFKDSDLEAKANDVFGAISLSIKTETAETYQKALDFIIKLLKYGFPDNYEIKISSKAEKKFLPIKGLAKSQTNRFFAQTLSFSELYDKIEEYAHAAMKEFAWYEDVEEGEKSCMPGSYAVFGLGLTDEKYFPLVQKYLDLVDDEHQSVHFYFLEEFAQKWGITEKTLPILCEGALSGQFQKPIKAIKDQINTENQAFVEDFIAKNYEKYEAEAIAFIFFGKR